ncbi:hypothetical protein E5361_07355 [Histophilus somni]|uniref:hypothetical protein n=1 Tax=Histophilus somni TaxID=731 RepID=UPI00109D0160|nr:hypothetical protein [Histophilus somni]THA21137.1 hypothetical protein E5361_07355 [Histophilus somni]
MKITDDKILDYIWEETLNKIATRTISHYIGHKLNTYDIKTLRDDDVDNFALLNRIELYAGITLSQSQFRIRLNKLINQGMLLPRSKGSFVINADVTAVAISAITFWQQMGLPFGFTDETRTCNKTIPAESINLFNLSTACYQLLKHKYPTYQIRSKKWIKT